MVQIKATNGPDQGDAWKFKTSANIESKSACKCWNTSLNSSVCEIVFPLFLVYFIVNFKDDLA